MPIIGEKGLVEAVEDGFLPFKVFFELLPQDFKTVLVAGVALGILLGIFHLLSR